MFDAFVFPVNKAFQLIQTKSFSPLISVITGGNLSQPVKDSVTEVFAYFLDFACFTSLKNVSQQFYHSLRGCYFLSFQKLSSVSVYFSQ